MGGYHDANAQVAQLFFSGSGVTDVTQVIPASPTQTLPNTAAGQYEYVLAQISVAAQSAATESSAWAVNEGGTIVAAASGAVSPVSLPSASGVTTATGFSAPSGSAVTFTASTNTYTTPALLSDPSRTLLWLNAGTGLSTSNAWSVPEWDDQSGNGIKCALYGVYGGDNPSVPTGSEIPAYVASAQGGQPAISFDGGNGKNDEFICNDVYVNGASNAFNSFSSLTIIFVASGSSSYTNGGGLIKNSIWTSTLATSLPGFANTSPMALTALNLWPERTVPDLELYEPDWIPDRDCHVQRGFKQFCESDRRMVGIVYSGNGPEHDGDSGDCRYGTEHQFVKCCGPDDHGGL